MEGDEMKRCVVIFNPASGNHPFEPHLPKLKKTLNDKGFTCNIKETEYPSHATELTAGLGDESVDLVIIIGGDGTFHEALNGLMKLSNIPRVGYIPNGTSCDIGHSLGLPKANVDKALEIIDHGTTVNMDVAETNFGYFTYVTAIGSYIDISYSTPRKLKRILGFMAYIISGIKEFFTISRIGLKIRHDNGVENGRYALALFVNSYQVAGLKVVKDPELDDGKIDVVLFRYIPFLNNIRFLFAFVFRRYRLPGVKRFKTTQAAIETSHQRPWNQDGEKVGSGGQTIKVLPRKLPIIINPKNHRFFKNQRT